MEMIFARQRENGLSRIQNLCRSDYNYRHFAVGPPKITPGFTISPGKLVSSQLISHRRLPCLASLPVHAAASTVELSSALFTLATTLVMPFYTIMILAPRKAWTKRVIESNIPHVVLGVMYTYLLLISWTPNTLHYMFASKYYLPELSGITQMFASTLTVASAWIHLLAADLFVGRQIFLEGLEHNIETRHSLILCLMICPVGMLCHIFTKAVTLMNRRMDKLPAP